MKKRKLIDRLASLLLVSVADGLRRAGYGAETDCCHGGATIGDYVNGSIVDVVYFRYEGQTFAVSVSNNDPTVCVNQEDTGDHDWINGSAVADIIKAAQDLIVRNTPPEENSGE